MFNVLNWGAGDKGWDFDEQGTTTRLSRTCDGMIDTWRGRLENAQFTFRMCGAEGDGFKKYIKNFLMWSSKCLIEF